MSTTQRTAVHKRDRDDTFILAVSHTTTTVEHERHETAEQEEEEVKKNNKWVGYYHQRQPHTLYSRFSRSFHKLSFVIWV